MNGSTLLDLVERGEEVVITPVAKQKVLFGRMHGEISWVEGWGKPFTDQAADDFFNGKC